MKLNKFGYILATAALVVGLGACKDKKEAPTEATEMAPPAENSAAPAEGAPAEGTPAETAPAATEAPSQ